MTQSSLNFEQATIDIVREAICRATRTEPVTIRRLKEELRRVRIFVSDRAVKGLVEHLRREGMLIGSNRQKPFGYWTPRSEKEEDELLHSYLAQAYTSLKIARMMLKKTKRGQAKGADQLVMDFVQKGLNAE